MKHSRLVASPRFHVLINLRVIPNDGNRPVTFDDVTDAEEFAKRVARANRGQMVRVVKEVCHFFVNHDLKEKVTP